MDSTFSNPAMEVRAILESQFLSMRVHSQDLGLLLNRSNRILATGGASVNHHVLQVLANVFGNPVYVSDVSGSAALGGAYRALHGYLNQTGECDYDELMKLAPSFRLVAEPNLNANESYQPMLKRYRELRDHLVSKTMG